MINNTKLLLPLMLSALMLSACQDNSPIEPIKNTATQSAEQATPTANPTTTSKTPEVVSMQAERTFEYTPVVPVNGAKMGVGAVGSSELTSIVVEIDDKSNWELLDIKYEKSLISEKQADELEIKADLKNYLHSMREEGVNPKDMHFVISSGAQKDGSADALIAALKSEGYFVNTIAAEDEAKYAFSATVPEEYRDNSFMVDIGSGNTKISWEDNGVIKAVETYGSNYFNEDTKSKQVNRFIEKLIDRIPKDKKENCFIIGGVPYHLAERIRADDERYVVLNHPKSYKADSKKLESGLNIYKAMVESTGEDTKYIFDFDSHYAIGFLKSL